MGERVATERRRRRRRRSEAVGRGMRAGYVGRQAEQRALGNNVKGKTMDSKKRPALRSSVNYLSLLIGCNEFSQSVTNGSIRLASPGLAPRATFTPTASINEPSGRTHQQQLYSPSSSAASHLHSISPALSFTSIMLSRAARPALRAGVAAVAR